MDFHLTNVDWDIITRLVFALNSSVFKSDICSREIIYQIFSHIKFISYRVLEDPKSYGGTTLTLGFTINGLNLAYFNTQTNSYVSQDLTGNINERYL
jgi:hypothetical protein